MKKRWADVVGVLGLAGMAVGSVIGLFVAPPDRFMQDTMRIIYIHVPTAWTAMLCFVFVGVCAVISLWRDSPIWDSLLEAGTEVGVVLGCLLTVQGSIWAKPTWNVWWAWDPRLTTVTIMVMSYAGIMALRSFVDDPRQRSTWSAVTAILATVNVPIVYYSVQWWSSLHQRQSTAETVDGPMAVPLVINILAFPLLAVWLVERRHRIAQRRADAENEPFPTAVERGGPGRDERAEAR